MTVLTDTNVERMQDELLGLRDIDFRTEVDADLRRAPREPAEAARHELRRRALRTPELIDRWYTVLMMMSRSVDGQLAALDEDHQAEKADLRMELPPEDRDGNPKWEEPKVAYARARAGKLRFKTGLDEWVIEARHLRDQFRYATYDQIVINQVVIEERNHYAGEAQRLRDAVREHHEALLADDDIDPSPADEKLWTVL